MFLDEFFKQKLDRQHTMVYVPVKKLSEQMNIVGTYEALCRQQNKDLMAKNVEIERLTFLLKARDLHVIKLEAELKEYQDIPKIDLRG